MNLQRNFLLILSALMLYPTCAAVALPHPPLLHAQIVIQPSDPLWLQARKRDIIVTRKVLNQLLDQDEQTAELLLGTNGAVTVFKNTNNTADPRALLPQSLRNQISQIYQNRDFFFGDTIAANRSTADSSPEDFHFNEHQLKRLSQLYTTYQTALLAAQATDVVPERVVGLSVVGQAKFTLLENYYLQLIQLEEEALYVP